MQIGRLSRFSKARRRTHDRIRVLERMILCPEVNYSTIPEGGSEEILIEHDIRRFRGAFLGHHIMGFASYYTITRYERTLLGLFA